MKLSVKKILWALKVSVNIGTLLSTLVKSVIQANLRDQNAVKQAFSTKTHYKKILMQRGG